MTQTIQMTLPQLINRCNARISPARRLIVSTMAEATGSA